MSAKYILCSEITSLRRCLRDLALHGIFNDWLTDRYLRPCLARWMGMKCGTQVVFCKCHVCGSIRHLRIGNKSLINRHVFFDTTSPITIGSHCAIGFGVSLITGTHEIGGHEQRCGPHFGSPITIEDGVWIGSGATILPGVNIGEGSIVAAGAVVAKSMPGDSLIGGVPARIIREL